MNQTMMILLWAYVLLVVPYSYAALHPTSPCPSIFSYEGTQPEHERWYGIVLLSTDQSLIGVRIDVRLDRPADILVSWMGTVTTEDNERFTILSLDQKLLPGPPIPSRFMVKFNSLKGSPQVRTIRLNGRQICPPDLNFATDVQIHSPDHLHENRYTTERVTRRPDLDFDDDWTNNRPVTTSRTPSTGDTYKPPKRHKPSGYGSGEDSSGYNSHETSNSGGHNSQVNKNPSGNGYSSSHTEKNSVRTTTNGYDSHESYGDRPHRPANGGSSNTYNNYSRPSSGNSDQQTYQNKPRPVATDETHYNGNSRPSINININKDVTYNVDRPDQFGYNNNNKREPVAVNRPSNDREPSYTNNQYPKTTERYSEQSSGIRDEFYTKPTTKKPIVINSINININSGDDEYQSGGSNSNLSKSTTTRRPYVNSNKNTSSINNNRPTTRRPVSSHSQKPSSNNGYRPNRNPDVSSSETHNRPGYGQSTYENNERTTEKNYQNNHHVSIGDQYNHRPSSSEFIDESHPSPIPSSRPNGGGGNKKIPRPQSNTGSKYGDKGELETANSNIKCGRVEVNPTPLITHGQNTARGQWPWHIALYRIDGINLSYSCGGSLISSTVVLTAAHCVTKAPRDRPVDADILVVQLGKYHLYQFSDDSVQNKQVQDVYVHPRYNSSNYLDDLALLVLSSPAEFTKYVRPVCLWPKHNFNLQSIDNKEGTVVGWGYDENNQVTEELKMARMPVVSYVTCLKSYPQFFSQFTAENKTFCAGFRQGTSVCNGDSGGGMVFQQDSVWYLRGLVSITVAKQGLRVCDTNHYVVFTDIANYIDWIHQHIS